MTRRKPISIIERKKEKENNVPDDVDDVSKRPDYSAGLAQLLQVVHVGVCHGSSRDCRDDDSDEV